MLLLHEMMFVFSSQKKKRVSGTAHCLVYMHPAMREKGCRLWILGLRKQQQGREISLPCCSAVEGSLVRYMMVPVIQPDSW